MHILPAASSKLPSKDTAYKKHAEVLRIVQEQDGFLFYATEHFRLSGVYWGLSALRLLNKDHMLDKDAIIEWVLDCRHKDGGFGGSPRQDPHMLYTLSAVQVLAIYGRLDLVDAEATTSCKYLLIVILP